MQISWDKLRNKDEQEWKHLFRQHAEFLYAYGMKFAHNEDLVKDTIQELFIAIYEKRNSLSEPTFIRAYLCTGLRNRLINELKKDAVVPLEEGDYSFTLYIDDESADEEERQYKKIQNLLNKLTNRQREVVYLKYFKGLSNEEIAKLQKQLADEQARRKQKETSRTTRLANQAIVESSPHSYERDKHGDAIVTQDLASTHRNSPVELAFNTGDLVRLSEDAILHDTRRNDVQLSVTDNLVVAKAFKNGNVRLHVADEKWRQNGETVYAKAELLVSVTKEDK